MSFSSAYRCLVLFVFWGLFSSCLQNQKDTLSEGELDLVAIASDTTMQNTIEDSYEFVRDIPFQNKQVFSIVNGGYTGFKDVLVAEKKSLSHYDTLAIVHLSDEKIIDAFVSDLDKNQEAEIHLIVESTKTKLLSDKIVLLVHGVWREQVLPNIPANLKPTGSMQWSIENDLLKYNFAIAEKDSIRPSGNGKVYFKLKNNIFTIEKMVAVL